MRALPLLPDLPPYAFLPHYCGRLILSLIFFSRFGFLSLLLSISSLFVPAFILSFGLSFGLSFTLSDILYRRRVSRGLCLWAVAPSWTPQR